MYPATVCAFAQGLIQIRWDAGGAPAWVPIANVRPPAPQHHMPQGQQPPYAPPPMPVAWQAQAQTPTAAPAPAPVPAAAPAAAAAPAPAPVAPVVRAAAPSGPPPRPTQATIGGLPRGLVYEPTAQGPGNGKSFFIFFGFIATADSDLAMRMTDIDHLGDDVAGLRAAGYRVIVDLHGDKDALNLALSGTHPEGAGTVPIGVFWGSHGEDDGAIGAFDGTDVMPEQISPEVAQKATVKLFVMSACYVGNHSARWQKALGPQALVIGWGAPITNERAVDFLTPDDSSTKDFDDLLVRHLGVQRVAADGPLTEVKELAGKHEDRLCTLLMPFDELIEATAKRMKCPMQRGKRGEGYFIVGTPPSKDYPDKPRAQNVRVAPVGVSDMWIIVSSLVGPYSDAIDLARGIRAVTPALHLRVAIGNVAPPDADFVMVETLFRRRRLDPYTLSSNIRMVGMYADKLEDLFFGSDQR